MSIIQSIGGGLGGAGAPGGPLGSFYGHALNSSLRFEDGDSAKLTRTPSSAGNRATWTWSGWIKRSTLGTKQSFFCSTAGDYNLQFFTNNKIKFEGAHGEINTSAVFRDTSAWYHIVAVHDTTESTSSDRFKIYVNSVQQTTSGSYPSGDGVINNTVEHGIGGQSSANFFDGYMAEVNFIDGQAYGPSYFGETKDGVWIPKAYSGSYGTNGFHLPFLHDGVSEGFTPVLYEGTRAVQSIRGVGFTPDLVWAKRRDGVQEGRITDSVRGFNRQLRPAASNSETTFTNAVTSFDADGFTLGVDHSSGSQSFNYYQDSHVAWCWEAGGAPTTDNSASAGATPTSGSAKVNGSNLSSALSGSVAITRLSANTTKGFSIVTYTGTGSGTVPHGLSSAPEFIISKNRDDDGTTWAVYAKEAGNGYLELDTAADYDSGTFGYNNTHPTSDVFTVDGSGLGASSKNYVSYCWHSVSGYSKFGSYTGSGSSGKAVTGLGFRPMFVMIKRTDSSGGWHVFDSVRFPNNPITKRLEWDNAEDENSDATVDIQFDSDGFTLLTSFDNMNATSGNYIFMAFADTRDNAFYKDTSGSSNHFSVSHILVNDVVPDSPTNNWSTLNPLKVNNKTQTFAEGNLDYSSTQTSTNPAVTSTFAVTSGKWYWEVYIRTDAGSNSVGIAKNPNDLESDQYALYNSADSYQYQTTGNKRNNSSSTSYGDAWTTGDIIGVALDLDAGAVYFYKNGTIQNSGTAAYTGLSGEFTSYSLVYQSGAQIYNFGQDDSFAGNKSGSAASSDSEGLGAFFYTVPSGYKSLCASNLPNITIGPGQSSQADDHFNTVLWTGNGTDGRTITGVNFAADWVWVKSRGLARSHQVQDIVRGFNDGTKVLRPNDDAGESDVPTDQYGFVGTVNSDGYTLEDGTSDGVLVNNNSETYVGWNWKAGGSASTISVGSISTGPDVPSIAASVSANTTSGFSIVGYTGTGSAGTIGHGLSSAPEFIIVKNRDDSSKNWNVYPTVLGNNYIELNQSNGSYSGSTYFNNTAPTASVFSVGTSGATNNSSDAFIAYCFHSIDGYSKAGKFTGNSSSDGTFVYMGFRPAWVLIKSTSSGTNWCIFDNKRLGYNVDNNLMRIPANSASSEQTDDDVDFVSNGLKFRRSSTNFNNSSHTYVYLAFADDPFKFANGR